jgi:Gram-negative bacterial TonB protein C-terminal
MHTTRIAIIGCLLSVAASCHAQQAPCGLTSMTETAKPLYPPIAKAAHVDGPVVMLATFKTTGEVEKVELISGPEMLRAAAIDYVKSWRANPYTGPRTCPVVVTFSTPHLATQHDPPAVVRVDPQHVTLNASYILLHQSSVLAAQ